MTAQKSKEQADKDALEATKRTLARVASALSGSLSGAAVSACVQPFDVVRTRMQSDAISGLFRSTPATFRAVVGEAGVRGLWRGTSATVTRLALGAGAHFTFLDMLRPHFETMAPDGSRNLSASGAALTGGLARAIATAVLCPISLIKTRMEATGTYMLTTNNMFVIARDIARTNGVHGLWRGVVPTILSNAPFSAIYYSVYSEIRKNTAGTAPQQAINLGAGFVAAMVATLATQPTDVIRARIQLGASQSTLETATTALREQGSRVFMSGAMPRFLKRSVQTALVWALYEELVPVITSAISREPQAAAS